MGGKKTNKNVIKILLMIPFLFLAVSILIIVNSISSKDSLINMMLIAGLAVISQSSSSTALSFLHAINFSIYNLNNSTDSVMFDLFIGFHIMLIAMGFLGLYYAWKKLRGPG